MIKPLAHRVSHENFTRKSLFRLASLLKATMASEIRVTDLVSSKNHPRPSLSAQVILTTPDFGRDLKARHTSINTLRTGTAYNTPIWSTIPPWCWKAWKVRQMSKSKGMYDELLGLHHPSACSYQWRAVVGPLDTSWKIGSRSSLHHVTHSKLFRHPIASVGGIGLPTRAWKPVSLIDIMSTFESVPDTFQSLDLPREIRDQVSKIIVRGEVIPPAQLIRRDRSSRHARDFETRKRGVKFRWSVARAASAGHDQLWAFVQQPVLAGKMREALEGESRNPGELRYKMNCMAENGDLQSIWTRLPAPSRYMKRIET